jgi:hypothetical protein
VATYYLLGLILQKHRLRTDFLLLTATLVLLGLWLWMRLGHVPNASVLTIFLAWMWLTIIAVTNGGINSPVVCLYIAIITTAGLIINRRAFIFITTLCVLPEIFIVFAVHRNLIPLPTPPTDIIIVTTHTITLMWFAILFFF